MTLLDVVALYDAVHAGSGSRADLDAALAVVSRSPGALEDLRALLRLLDLDAQAAGTGGEGS